MKKKDESKTEELEKTKKSKKTANIEKLDDGEKEKVMNIVKSAKEKGKITYGELAAELGDVNPEQIDKVFDAFEELGVDILKDEDLLEPDVDDLKEVEEIRKQLPIVVYDLKKRNHVKFSERYDNYQDALKTQELFEKMGFEDKVEVNVGWFDKALFGLKTKWDRFIENRDKNLLLSDGSEKENTEPENTETSSLRDEIKVKANPEPQKSEPVPVEAKEQENEER